MQTTRQVKMKISTPFSTPEVGKSVFYGLLPSKVKLAQFSKFRMAIDISAYLKVFAAMGNRTENPCVAGSIPAPATTFMRLAKNIPTRYTYGRVGNFEVL